MQAKLNDDELFGETEQPDDIIDSTDDAIDSQGAFEDSPDGARDDSISDPFERIQNAVSQAAARVGQGLRAAWARLVPSVAELEDDLDEPTVSERPEVFDDEPRDQDGFGADDDEDEEIIDDTVEHTYRKSLAPAADAAVHPDRLITAKRRRPTTIHSPIAVKQNLIPNASSGPKPLSVDTPLNQLSWDRAQGILTIYEPIPEEIDAENPRESRSKRSVALTVRLLDERIVPILMGVVNAIDGGEDSLAVPEPAPVDPNRRVRRAERRIKTEQAEQAASEDWPYVCESGPNTFCWYRTAQVLKIYGQKRVDDRGLLRSSKCVVLHVKALPVEAKELFLEILNLRAQSNPYRAMI